MSSGSLPPPRFALLGALALLTLLAGVRLATAMDDPADFLLALGLVALFTPLKALMIRWLGGRRPYQSAFAASLFSAIVGMVFREPLNIWSLLFRSTMLTAALETLPLFAMRTSDSPMRVFVLSGYMSVVVHLLSGGFVLLSWRPLVGGLLMVAGVAAMWSPLFIRRFQGSGDRAIR
ncbi:MAG: hypothetical protein OXE58_04520 [Acidobacteria bacterium]|nr:hypothetical protein [Acidobacteriota bacterium]